MATANDQQTKGPKHIPYEIDPNDRAHFYENYWKKVALELLLKHASPEGKTVLDYGCGRGETLDIFGQAGFKVTGTDTDPECVRLAGKYGDTNLLQVNDPVSQFGENSFSVVTCFHVMEHVDNPKKTLNDMRTIARDYVLLAVPNLRYLHRIFERKFELTQVNEGHLQSWDHWHLRNLAERHSGLKLVEWGSDATALPLLSQLVSSLFGQDFAIKCETGIFRQLFPYHCISVIGLFKVV